jgi:hypothetical protein
MEDSAFIGGVIAGIVYLAAGIRLVRLSWRTQASPELMLGLAFILWALSYACWQIPIATANQPLTQPLFFAGRAFTNAGTIFLAYFVWVGFRNQSHWAKYLVHAITLGLLAGMIFSVAEGDWEGIQPTDNPWWYLDWGAGFMAMAWVGVEGLIEYPKARKRVQLGHCDPLVCHRLFLWAVVGIVWTVYNGVYLYQVVEFETTQIWSAGMDRAIAATEAIGIALVCLIFFPPRFYKRWVAGAAPAADSEEA